MRRRAGQAGVVLIVLLVAAVAALWSFQRTFFYRPQAIYQAPASLGLTGVDEIRTVTKDGLSLVAWHMPAQPGRPTIVFFHGNGGIIARRHWRILRWQKQGYGTLLVEYRGYGGNPGTPTEDGLYADGRAALDWLADHGVPSTSLFLAGESLGTGIAVKLATERKVAGVILEAPYTSTPDVAQMTFWMLPVHWMVWDRYDSLSRIRDIDAPLLVMHGGADAAIPQAQGRRLFETAREPKVGYFPPGAHHMDLVLHGAYDQIDAFIAKYWK